MSEAAIERHAGSAPFPVVSGRELFPYALLAGILLLTLVYFVGAEEGAAAVTSGTGVHELLHDARHLLGFPCH